MRSYNNLWDNFKSLSKKKTQLVRHFKSVFFMLQRCSVLEEQIILLFVLHTKQIYGSHWSGSWFQNNINTRHFVKPDNGSKKKESSNTNLSFVNPGKVLQKGCENNNMWSHSSNFWFIKFYYKPKKNNLWIF